MQVKSKPGTKCPKEGKPRKYIEDAEFVTVPDTAYYKRLVRDGSLQLADLKPKSKSAAGGSKPKAQKK